MSLMNFREPNQVKWVGVRPAHNGIQIQKQGEAENGIVIIHTVTSGRTFYLTSVSWSANSSQTAVNFCLGVRNTSDVFVYDICAVFFRAVGQVGWGLTFNPPLEIPSGYDIYVHSSAVGASAKAFIHGWED